MPPKKTQSVAQFARPEEDAMIHRLSHACWNLSAAKVLGGLRCVKGKARGVGLLVLAVGLGACAQKPLVPDAPGVAGPILQEVPGLSVAVEAEAWNARPSGLADTVLPLLITVKNTGTRPVTLARQDFALLDQANRQYLPIAAVDVAAMYGGSGSGTAVYPSIGFGGSSGGGSFVGGGLGLSFGSWGSDTRDIIPLALADGLIQPSAEVRGFLYFPRPAPDSQVIRLVAILRDLPGTPQLEFHFRRAE